MTAMIVHAQSNIDAFSFVSNGLAGLADSNGKIIVEPTFKNLLGEVDPQCRCIVAHSVEGNFGIIDLSGRWLVPAQYTQAKELSQGMAAVKRQGAFWFIDANGRIKSGPYDYAMSYSEGVAAVLVGSKWGFVDLNGKLIVPAIYNEVPDHLKKVAWAFAPANMNDGTALVRDDYGVEKFIAKDGRTVLKVPDGLTANSFSEGLAVVTDEAGRCGLIDRAGQIVLKPRFREIRPLSDGLAAFSDGSGWGFLDRDGKVVIEPRFEDVLDFSEGAAAVCVCGKWCFIGRDGKFLFDPEFDSLGSLRNGRSVANLKGKSLLTNVRGETVAIF